MNFENKGKWLNQIQESFQKNEGKGVTINGEDNIELDFDTRQAKVYITINGELTYKVDEDKFMQNVSDFVYNQVDKDKTKFKLNWDKHFGKLNRFLRKVESIQKTESISAKDKGLYEKKTKQHAIRYLYNKINTKGIFRDNDWSGLRKITDQIRNLGVELTIAPTNDSWHKSGYAVNDKNIPTEKRYDIEINYTNIDGKEMTIKGQIACQGAGSVNDPLDAYDIVMTLY